MKRKNLLLTVGVPGSGKSHWCNNFLANNKHTVYISRDEIRFEFLKDGEDYFSHEDLVYSTFVHRIKKAIENPEVLTIIADATHLNERSRNKLLSQIPSSKVRIIPVFFNIPLDVCIERNNLRNGRAKVPENTIRNMAEILTNPKKDKRFRYFKVFEVDKDGNLAMQ